MKQDQLLGTWNLTKEYYKLDWRSAMNLLSGLELDKFDNIPRKEYTGKEVFSYLIPKKINLLKGDPSNPKILVKNGILEAGLLGEDALGVKKKNSLVQLVWDEYGVETTKKFLDNTTKLANSFNMYHGMTVGIGDLYIPDKMYHEMTQLYDSKKLEIQHEITELENNPEMMDELLFETSVNSKLAVIRDDASKLIIANTPGTNMFITMMDSGAKGKAINLAQMAGCVGQQDFHGGRMKKNYNERSLPYFFKNDDRAESRGFIEKPFMRGLNLPDFIFHHLSAREGLIDQTVRTAESGYIQRKLIKATEDMMVNYDGTVRNAVGRILQFQYGDSGADTVKQYEYNFKVMEMGNEEIKTKYGMVKEELSKVKGWTEADNKKFVDRIIEMRDKLRKTQVKATLNYLTLSNSYMLPVNLYRIVDNFRNDESLKGTVCYEPKYILDMIEEILEPYNTRLYCLTPDEMKNINSVKYKDDQVAKTAFKYAMLDILAPKKCIFNYKLSKEQLDGIKKEIIKSFNKSIVEPGEMVGIVAAQSLGEPVTQLMLNAFHASGVGGKGGTNIGVDRIKEVFSLSKNPKEPEMEIYLDAENRTKKDFANKIASHIKFTTIKDLRTKIQTLYDPNPYDPEGFIAKDNVGVPFYTYQSSKQCCANSIDGLPWLMRIEFDREKLLTKEVSLLDIKSQFCFAWEKRYTDVKGIKREKKQLIDKITQLAVLSNTDNDEIPILHIRFDMTNFTQSTLVDFMDLFVDEFKLKGMPGIEDIRGGGKAFEERIISFDNDDQIMEKNSEYVIYTKGINMDAIKNIVGVDLNRTYCNDIISIYENFGIEAARNFIIRQIITVLTSNGSGTNYQHIEIFGDLMAHIGTLTSIDRHGLNKLDTDPLSRASFEKTVDQLITAAIFNEVDYMKSVSSRIMAGLCIKGGTGLCNIILDKDMLENSEYTTDIGQLYNKTYKDITSTLQTQEIDEDVFIPEM
jgi:DNA-directed RNA polymerase II subunit RPB1